MDRVAWYTNPALDGGHTMKTSEGKLGRVFMLRLERGDDGPEPIEKFAADNGILFAQIFIVSDAPAAGILAPDASGHPRLRLSGGTENTPPDSWQDAEVIVQEMLGVSFRRLREPGSNRGTLIRINSSKSRVMNRAAPEPADSGPGTIPVYLFNVEFN